VIADGSRTPLFFVRELASIRADLYLALFGTLKRCGFVCDEFVLLGKRLNLRDPRAPRFCCQLCLHFRRQ